MTGATVCYNAPPSLIVNHEMVIVRKIGSTLVHARSTENKGESISKRALVRGTRGQAAIRDRSLMGCRPTHVRVGCEELSPECSHRKEGDSAHDAGLVLKAFNRM